MKKFRKLIPALCMLLISAMLMGTSTYAWFSMNRTVTASGMQVKATTAGDLYIYNGQYSTVADKDKWNAAPELSTIADAFQNNIPSITTYSTSPATLTPSSSSNFSNWFYLSNASEIPAGGGIYSEGPGADKVNSVTYSDNDLAQTANYVQVSRCYLAMNEKEQHAYATLSCTATISATSNESNKMLNTIRVAVTVSCSVPETGECFTKVWSADGDDNTQPLATVTTLASKQTCVQSGVSDTVVSAPKSNVVYTVTVFIWVEGQDSECLNNNALNSDAYAVNLSFTIA